MGVGGFGYWGLISQRYGDTLTTKEHRTKKNGPDGGSGRLERRAHSFLRVTQGESLGGGTEGRTKNQAPSIKLGGETNMDPQSINEQLPLPPLAQKEKSERDCA